MEFKKVKKEFKLVGMKNSGAFANFGNEVPMFARQFITRSNEVPNHLGTEIALYEPKKNIDHLEGHYYVGLLVNETLSVNETPHEMEYIEISQDYINARGKIYNVGDLHLQLLAWGEEQGIKRDLESYIVETYHQIGNGEEEVEIYLPIL